MSTITIEEVSKAYGPKLALDGLSLDVHSGEMIAILGSSGCGKTTLLRCLAGLVTPDSGTIRFGGEDVTRLPPQERPIGMVFQSYALFPNMTVAGNIGFPLKVRARPAREIADRIEELLDLVELTALAGRYPNELSGGQQQRTALARALAPAPQVLLLDEPLSALDAVVRDNLRDELRRIQQKVRTTALLVTHDQAEALAVADRVVVMQDGRIEQLATPEVLYDHPRTAFSASFIGNRNALRLPVVGGTVRLGKALALETVTAATAAIFVRPEDVKRSPPGCGEPAQVESRMFQGQTTRFYLRLDHDGDVMHLRADWPAREVSDIRVGDTVHIALAPEDVHVFQA
ncbi:ABC transporter ATP-binding protein [Rhizobium sp. KAs_5_22]|uniref:ABC transporter ATP-binding protein n=1 Tax=Ciceribacter selenitireducens TaxID=448181 RepID=UPI00048C54ED|nr:ABC transporter ATP-binding protein [Ciceribacter selenitireducens]PPJ46816.1 ABC transporter ATP-binding protein [Rhizobium sp. KAs_5_22]